MSEKQPTLGTKPKGVNTISGRLVKSFISIFIDNKNDDNISLSRSDKNQNIKFDQWVSWLKTGIVICEGNIKEGYEGKIENNGIKYSVIVKDVDICESKKAFVEVNKIEDPDILYNKKK